MSFNVKLGFQKVIKFVAIVIIFATLQIEVHKFYVFHFSKNCHKIGNFRQI